MSAERKRPHPKTNVLNFGSRDKIVKSVLAKAKAKRNELKETYRLGEGSDIFRKQFINEALQDEFKPSRRNNSNEDDNDDNDDSDDNDNFGLDPDAYMELMQQIEEEMREELEMEEYSELQQLQQCTEYNDSGGEEEELYYDHGGNGDNPVICPVCRSQPLTLDNESKAATCSCGAVVNMFNTRTGLPMDLEALRGLLASIFDRHCTTCSLINGASSQADIGAGMWIPDSLVDRGIQADSLTDRSNKAMVELDFQIFNEVLHAWCCTCGFHEEIS